MATPQWWQNFAWLLILAEHCGHTVPRSFSARVKPAPQKPQVSASSLRTPPQAEQRTTEAAWDVSPGTTSMAPQMQWKRAPGDCPMVSYCLLQRGQLVRMCMGVRKRSACWGQL
jgi:hypothetical protein